MKFNTAVVIIVLAYLAVISFAVWWTKNPNCLWALLLIGSFKSSDSKTDDELNDIELDKSKKSD